MHRRSHSWSSRTTPAQHTRPADQCTGCSVVKAACFRPLSRVRRWKKVTGTKQLGMPEACSSVVPILQLFLVKAEGAYCEGLATPSTLSNGIVMTIERSDLSVSFSQHQCSPGFDDPKVKQIWSARAVPRARWSGQARGSEHQPTR
jgi:hypothetical protein